jgi:stage II sporulation protein D
MRRFFPNKSILLILLSLFYSSFAQSNQIIRVLLNEKNSQKESHFFIEAEGGLRVLSPHTSKKILVKDKSLEVIVKNNNIYLSQQNKKNNKIRKVNSKEIRLVPQKHNLVFEKIPYQGGISLQIDEKNNTLYIINSVTLDDYIYSVLISESYQTWPMEIQKVQAIVSRTYAIYYINENRKNKKNIKPYDLKRSNFHQTYNGMHNYTHLRQAIQQTDGIILTHNNKAVLAMFDACCGGIIPANMKSLNFEKAPYLARKKCCTHCKNYKLYKWHRDIYINSFFNRVKSNAKIASKVKSIGKLKDICITEKDKAGIVHKIKLVGSKKNVTIKGQDLWESMRDQVKSLNFKIKKIRDRIVIDGNGFGHQIGLCQRGARELVRRGWDCKDILSFYYPNTKFARLLHAKI